MWTDLGSIRSNKTKKNTKHKKGKASVCRTATCNGVTMRGLKIRGGKKNGYIVVDVSTSRGGNCIGPKKRVWGGKVVCSDLCDVNPRWPLAYRPHPVPNPFCTLSPLSNRRLSTKHPSSIIPLPGSTPSSPSNFLSHH